MVDEILANPYKIEIPLLKNPFKTINSYVIRNSERNLIVDTGWNQEECMNAMQAGLRELGVDLREKIFLLHIYMLIILVLPPALPGIPRRFTSTDQMLSELNLVSSGMILLTSHV